MAVPNLASRPTIETSDVYVTWVRVALIGDSARVLSPLTRLARLASAPLLL